SCFKPVSTASSGGTSPPWRWAKSLLPASRLGIHNTVSVSGSNRRLVCSRRSWSVGIRRGGLPLASQASTMMTASDRRRHKRFEIASRERGLALVNDSEGKEEREPCALLNVSYGGIS